MAAILLVAAEGIEFAGLVRRIGGERLDWPVGFARRARRPGGWWLMVANGAGPARAAEAVRVAAERELFDLVASVGYCGGLDAALRAGEIVVADRVEAPESGESFPAAERMVPHGGRRGSIISIDRFVRTPEEKRRLGASGAVAVEMEAAGVAREVRGLGLPFVSVRVVTDQAGEGFIIDYNQARDASGRFRWGRVAGLALRSPWRAFPELARFYRRARMASEALGEFLANCEFQV
jgi:adenosylhomocysteine nucleosidase